MSSRGSFRPEGLSSRKLGGRVDERLNVIARHLSALRTRSLFTPRGDEARSLQLRDATPHSALVHTDLLGNGRERREWMQISVVPMLDDLQHDVQIDRVEAELPLVVQEQDRYRHPAPDEEAVSPSVRDRP